MLPAFTEDEGGRRQWWRRKRRSGRIEEELIVKQKVRWKPERSPCVVLEIKKKKVSCSQQKKNILKDRKWESCIELYVYDTDSDIKLTSLTIFVWDGHSGESGGQLKPPSLPSPPGRVLISLLCCIYDTESQHESSRENWPGTDQLL